MSTLPSIAKHAKDHGIEPLKRLGQNFLFDSSLCSRIARCANIQKDDVIVEIGPGTAGLTRAILELNPKKLIAIETDKRCIGLLNEIKTIYPNLEIIEADALKKSIKDLLQGHSQKAKIISNLPYNIGTTLILNWFKELEYIESINVMVQREVADRISADSGNKTYGRLSIISQLLCNAKKQFDVSPDAFYPKPKVWSSIISLTPKNERPTIDEISVLEKITQAAFSMRRKMLKSSLKSIVPEDIIGQDRYALRAENLDPIEYLIMAQKISR